jgi:biopolymer transport protein ExbD
MLLKMPEVNDAAGIELTPMIDMVFLLLTFFLVATTFHQEEREMDIALPYANAAAPISALLHEFVVNVAGDGGVIVSGKTIDAEQLKAMVAETVKLNPDQKVTVRGDRNTPYAAIAKVLDICKQGGIQQPYLDTIPER